MRSSVVLLALWAAPIALCDLFLPNIKDGKWFAIYVSAKEQIVVRECLSFSSSKKRPAFECAGKVLIMTSREDFTEVTRQAFKTALEANADAGTLTSVTSEIESLMTALEEKTYVSEMQVQDQLAKLKVEQRQLIFFVDAISGANEPRLKVLNTEQCEAAGFQVELWFETLAKRDFNYLAKKLEEEKQAQAEALRRAEAIKQAQAAEKAKLRDAINSLSVDAPNTWQGNRRIGTWKHFSIYHNALDINSLRYAPPGVHYYDNAWFTTYPRAHGEDLNLMQYALKEFYRRTTGEDLIYKFK